MLLLLFLGLFFQNLPLGASAAIYESGLDSPINGWYFTDRDFFNKPKLK